MTLTTYDCEYTFNGWTCPQCGAWVPSGQTHSCYWYQPYQPLPNCQQCQKIEELIRKLTEVLDKLNSK